MDKVIEYYKENQKKAEREMNWVRQTLGETFDTLSDYCEPKIILTVLDKMKDEINTYEKWVTDNYDNWGENV